MLISSLLSNSLLSTPGSSGRQAGPMPAYFSDRGWTAQPDDSALPNRHFLPRLKAPLSIERTIPVSPLDTQRVMLPTGRITFENGDAGMNDLVNRTGVDGRSIEVLWGRPRDRFSAFQTLFKGTAIGWAENGDNLIDLQLRDLAFDLDQPIQRRLYSGLGGLEGGADLAGKPKRKVYGRARNVSCELVDAAANIWQVNDGPVEAFMAVKDSGVAFAIVGDTADLYAAAPPSGCCVTNRAGGYFRLGSVPAGIVTCDLKGDRTGGLYVETTASIVFRILHDTLQMDDGRFHYPAFDRLNLTQPAPVGVVVDTERTTAEEVINTLLVGIGGWLTVNNAGKFEIGVTGLPGAKAKLKLTDQQLLDLRRIELPDDINPPFWRVSVGYQPNWTPMSASDVAGSVLTDDPDTYLFLTQAIRYVAKQDTAIMIKHLQAQDVYINGCFAAAEDAERQADAILETFGRERKLYSARTKLAGYMLPRGITIAIESSRYDLTPAVNAMVIGTGIDAASAEATIDLLI